MPRVTQRAKKPAPKGRASTQRRKAAPKLTPKRGTVPRKASNWLHARARDVKRGQNVRGTFIGVALGLCTVFMLALWIFGGMGTAVKSVQATAERGLLAAGFGVSYIEVVGPQGLELNSSDKAAVRQALAVEQGELVFSVNLGEALARVENLGWVKEARIMRQLPDRLTVIVVGRPAYALWQSTSKIHVIGKNGNLLDSAKAENYTALPLAVGVGAPQALETILLAMEHCPKIKAQVYAYVRVSNRRWNIRLKSGADVMLPEHQMKRALKSIEQNQQLVGLLTQPLSRIDVRLEGQVLVRRSLKPEPVIDDALGKMS